MNGGEGADNLVGGTGDDTYTVDNAADVVTESLNEGTDRIIASVSYALGAHVEHLTLTGTSAVNGIGNGLDNSLTGNTAANFLSGGAGADTIRGGDGNDKLDGGEGNDTLNGGRGYDGAVYTSSSSGVTVDLSLATPQDTGGAGVDTLSSIEDVSGSEFADTITGNASNNWLSGRGGDDTLVGGAGADRLRGGTGADTMIGGTGKDTYDVDDIGDVVVELANEGTADLVVSSITYALTDNVE